MQRFIYNYILIFTPECWSLPSKFPKKKIIYFVPLPFSHILFGISLSEDDPCFVCPPCLYQVSTFPSPLEGGLTGGSKLSLDLWWSAVVSADV